MGNQGIWRVAVRAIRATGYGILAAVLGVPGAFFAVVGGWQSLTDRSPQCASGNPPLTMCNGGVFWVVGLVMLAGAAWAGRRFLSALADRANEQDETS